MTDLDIAKRANRKIFGRLTVLNDTGKYWECLCSCGNKKMIEARNLIYRRTKSCGCLQKEVASKTFKKHGMNTTPTYKIWHGMLTRCRKKNHISYRHYGGRGITVCEKWLQFTGFFEDMGVRPEEKSLDRIDNSKGYFKENCRWATQKEQMNNTRQNRLATINGETLNMTQWAKRLNINRGVVSSRFYSLGWSLERSLTEPIHKK